MLQTQEFVKKDLENLEAFQHTYGGTDVAEVEVWLNNYLPGHEVTLFGWQGLLLVKLDGIELFSVTPGQWMVRSGTGKLLVLSDELFTSLWEPAP